MTLARLNRILTYSLLRLRKFVLWIPVLALLLGSGVSIYVYKNLKDREREILRADSIQRYREMINQLDLLFSNSILRIQSYEDYLGSRPRAYREDSAFMRQSLEYTIFQRFSIWENTHHKLTHTHLPVLKVLLRMDTKNSTLAPLNASTIQSEVVLQAMKHLMDSNVLQVAVLHTYEKNPRASFILRSRTNKDIFFIFTAPLSAIFAKTDLRPGESLDITDAQSGLSWRVEANENHQKTVRPNAPGEKTDPRDGFHHYLYVEGLPQSGMRINFAFNFKEPERQLSPAVIAGLMSFMLTLIISYLFLVLVRQNTLVTRLVIEKTHDLAQAHHEMQEILLGKSRFLGNISHEIRTPLNLILGMIDLCEEEDKDKKIAEYLKSMRASGNHLLSMIEDLLDLAKSDTNDLQIHFKKINLVQFLDETARIAGQDFLKKNLRFYTDFAADLPVSIQCDPSRLRQILMNLLRNACKYTNHGHVTFKVSRVGEGGARALLRFEVADTGVGIPSDKLGKIFDAFFQVEASYVLAEGGVGLGLAIVKELVRKLGGKLEVDSQPKRGSTFRVDLEVESLEAAPWLESYRAHDDQKKDLVIVSKDPLWVESLSSLTTHSQIRWIAIEPEKAKEYLDKNPPQGARWILVDATNEGFSLDLIHRESSYGYVIVAGNRKHLLELAKDPQLPIVDNCPLLVTDLLAAMSYSSKSRRRIERKETEKPAGAPASVATAPLSLIVADDDIGNKELYQAYFEKTKWNVSYAMNGKEAWDLYLEKPADILVLDLRMPVMDGFEVVEKVREYEQQNHLPLKPILLVTADALDTTANKALSLPKVSFLTKPIKKSTLFASIEKVVEPPATP